MLNNLRAVFARRSDVVRLGIVMTPARRVVPSSPPPSTTEIIAATAPFN